jgi:hypothetical protein
VVAGASLQDTLDGRVEQPAVAIDALAQAGDGGAPFELVDASPLSTRPMRRRAVLVPRSMEAYG